MSNESTFAENLTSLEACRAELEKLVAELMDELRRKAADRAVRKAFVKLKFADFTRTSHECVCAEPNPEVFQGLLEAAHARSPLSVRLLGAGVRFSEETPRANAPAQLDLFGEW